MSAAKREVIRNLELLIIDEVSMLRADLLDAIDFVLRKIRNHQQPFRRSSGTFYRRFISITSGGQNRKNGKFCKGIISGMFFSGYVSQE
ncbi:MAG: hypothetical protein IPG18_15365 [Saprospiraceae bacterium]|nr:hypothetical protein [Saprospiraceae bacterium]